MTHALRKEFVAANGLTFEVDVCGSGDRLALCLHGFPELAYSWRYQRPLLADVVGLAAAWLTGRPVPQMGDLASGQLLLARQHARS